jgi:hypothetical protein
MLSSELHSREQIERSECPAASTHELPRRDMTKRGENAEFLAVGWKTHP